MIFCLPQKAGPGQKLNSTESTSSHQPSKPKPDAYVPPKRNELTAEARYLLGVYLLLSADVFIVASSLFVCCFEQNSGRCSAGSCPGSVVRSRPAEHIDRCHPDAGKTRIGGGKAGGIGFHRSRSRIQTRAKGESCRERSVL